MKKTKSLMIAGMLTAAAYAGVASAHDYVYSLGVANSTAARTDIFGIQCLSPTAKIVYQVRDNLSSPEKATTIRIRGATTVAGLAAKAWDNANQTGGFTPLRTMTNGATTYYFEINKNAVAGVLGLETYTARIHCQDSSNGHTDQSDSPDFWTKRNQP